MVKVTKISTVTATGAKELTVKFNQAVDTTKATFTVKRASVTANVSNVAWSADNTEATLTLATKLVAGTYTVTATGVADSSASVDVEDETVADIVITNKTAPVLSSNNAQAYVYYKVTNQYGEEMSLQTINWTNSTGGTTTVVDKNTLRISNTSAGTTDFIPGAVVYMTGVHAASGTVCNDSVTIGLTAKADAVAFKGVYSLDDSEITALPAGFDAGDYVLLYQVNDQYGNLMSNPTYSDLVFTTNNPLFVSSTFSAATDVIIDGVTYEALNLSPGTTVDEGGTSVINVISINTGKQSSYTITADSLSLLTTLTMGTPADMVSVGETVTIPFEAFDQNGVQITAYDDLVGKVTWTKPSAAASFGFVEQADGSAAIQFNTTGLSEGYATVATLVTGKASFSSLNIYVEAAATPTVVVGVDSDISSTVALGNTYDLEAKDLIIEDQYGRVMDDSDITSSNTYVVYTTYNMSSVAGTPTDLSFSGDSIAVDNGTTQTVSSIEFALYTDLLTAGTPGTLIAGSEYSVPITVTTQSNYASYEVADLGLMYNDASTTTTTDTDFDKTVKVYGVKSNGTKVLLPTSEYTVTTDAGTHLAVASNVISDATVAANGYATSDFVDSYTGEDITIPVEVTVVVRDTAASGAVKATIVKDLTVSHEASYGVSISMNDTGIAGKYNISAATTPVTVASLSANAIEEVLDQYGVAMTPASTAVISNVVKVTGSTFAVGGGNITGHTVGDTFTATFTYGTTWIVNTFSDNFFKVCCFEFNRRHIIKRRMNSDVIIPMNIIKQFQF